MLLKSYLSGSSSDSQNISCSVKRLCLQHCHLSDKCAQIIISGLYIPKDGSIKSYLTELNLSNNRIGYVETDSLDHVDRTCCETLGEVLASNNCVLEELHLGW